jgi:transposase-like protein
MKKQHYSKVFRQEMVEKAKRRGHQTLEEFATDQGVNFLTLKNWLAADRQKQSGFTSQQAQELPTELPADQWSAAERLQALNQTHGLEPVARSAWCRSHGLFEHHLRTWADAFCEAIEAPASKAQLRELERKYQASQRELNRKDKALAEAAALLVLQKKFQALLEGEDK